MKFREDTCNIRHKAENNFTYTVISQPLIQDVKVTVGRAMKT